MAIKPFGIAWQKSDYAAVECKKVQFQIFFFSKRRVDLLGESQSKYLIVEAFATIRNFDLNVHVYP